MDRIYGSKATRTTVEERRASSNMRPTGLRWKQSLHRLTWLCLLLACAGASWFSYQYFLVPHPASFAPQWQGAQWVRAADGDAPVAYFRYDTSLAVLPDGAFVTVAANQIFRLYVNGTFIGSNSLDFTHGDLSRAYMYDVVSLLRLGRNVIAFRVSNVDLHVPAIRASFGVVHGQSTSFHSSGSGWLATVGSSLAHQRYAVKQISWAESDFDDSSWQAVLSANVSQDEPTLSVNPLIYEQPIPTQWISAGSGHEGYFVRQIQVPINTSGTWLRLVATGTARIFINGNLFMVWNGQAPVQQQTLADYLSSDSTIAQYRSGLVLGVYDISSYIHPGLNTLAIHVSAPGIIAARAGLDNLNAAIALDLLSTDLQKHTIWLAASGDWHTSYRPVDGWAQGSSVALAWPQPLAVGRPGTARMFYLSDVSNPRGQQFIPLSLIALVVLGSCLVVVMLWLCMALLLLRHCFESRTRALEACVLGFMPALGVEVLLLTLAREPQMPRPFPYTWFWALCLLILTVVGFVLLALNARLGGRRRYHRRALADMPTGAVPAVRASAHFSDTHASFPGPAMSWLRSHWSLLLLVALVLPLVCYNLAYEPYWQDELTSYYAAKGILMHGIPLLPSGFLYPKGELYSYLLALCMAIFGDQNGMPRVLSVVEYFISLPILYAMGCSLFQRRIALLATAMLALSPMVLEWSRQARMYEQAQLMTMLVLYLFYRALHAPSQVQKRRSVCLIYLAWGALALDYLSHEETFIIFPSIALWLLLTCRTVYLYPLLAHLHDPQRNARPRIHMLKHWLIALLLTGGIVGLQLLVARYSHPPLLGTDQSQSPLVHFTTNNISYYLYLMFYPALLGNGTLPWITLNSLLALVGGILALRQRNLSACYCAVFMIISFMTLMLMFTLTSDRYIYPLLPAYYLLGAYALCTLLQRLQSFVQGRLVTGASEENGGIQGRLARPTRVAAMATSILFIACVLLLPMFPLSGYNLFVSKTIGVSYHRHYADYDAVGSYMQSHWQMGDVVVAVSPAISVLYYVGHVDYFFSVDRALYLFEKDGRIIDTPTGSTALLDQQDFQAVVAAHTRVWIISDSGLYQSEVTKDSRFVFPPDFHLVYEGYGSAIYFRGS